VPTRPDPGLHRAADAVSRRLIFPGADSRYRPDVTPGPTDAFPLLPRTHLRRFERVLVPVMEWLNRRPAWKNTLHRSIGHFNGAWITATSGRTWQVYGQDGLRRLDAPDGLVLVSNHRSFFDMYAIATVVLNEAPHLEQRACFPVRAPFFYDNPLGLLLNLAISGGSMWPPVFRDERRRTLNSAGLDQMAAWLQRGAVIGIHPEGARGKGPDLYEFLPLKPGLGHLLERAPRGDARAAGLHRGLRQRHLAGDAARFSKARSARATGANSVWPGTDGGRAAASGRRHGRDRGGDARGAAAGRLGPRRIPAQPSLVDSRRECEHRA
jgi:hypothetical protein